MGRILLILVVLFVVLWLVRGFLLTRKRDTPPPEKLPGELVTCAHCGVHLPRAEARSAGGLDYCSDEHGRLGPREPP
ncbi:MAG TPA: PP0621 family protein [Burkholderiales bacterium]|nr:PP0621 family protein [Burkholderiales bacterium]